MGTVTTRELTCIGCPMGCPLIVTMEAGEVISVTGNTCKSQMFFPSKDTEGAEIIFIDASVAIPAATNNGT